ncbi:MAG: hypothetical protein ACRC68_08965 [Clostridium sp.]
MSCKQRIYKIKVQLHNTTIYLFEKDKIVNLLYLGIVVIMKKEGLDKIDD